jgi:DNA-binding transcriptional MocR family regulator
MGYKGCMNKTFRKTQISMPEGFLDLGRGDPQLALLPLELLHRAADVRLGQPDNSFLQYGPEQGDGYLRLALADFLAAGSGSAADPDRLFITAGISSALDLLCTLLTRPGDTVFVEEPSYFLALSIFADHKLRVVSLPTDESGLIMGAVEEALRQDQPKFLYIIPAFQNPSGHTLTEDRRRRLTELSRDRGFLVVADEVYQYLHYTLEPPRHFGSYAGFDNIISLGSFSKILAPGLRLGWLQADPNLIKRLAGSGLLTSGGGMNPFTSAIVRGLIENGDLQKNIAHLISVYSSRVQAMDAALRKHLPEAEFTTPHGGYFFWARLPGCNLQAIRKAAQEHEVDYRPGSLFSSRGEFNDYLRLSISYYDPPDIDRALERLAQALKTAR